MVFDEYKKEVKSKGMIFYYDRGEKNGIVTIRTKVLDATFSFGFVKTDFYDLWKCFQKWGTKASVFANEILPYDPAHTSNTYYRKNGRSFANFTDMRAGVIKNILDKESVTIQTNELFLNTKTKDDESSTDSNSSE